MEVEEVMCQVFKTNMKPDLTHEQFPASFINVYDRLCLWCLEYRESWIGLI